MIPILGKITSLKEGQEPVVQGVLDDIVRKSTNIRHISSASEIDDVQYGEVVVFDDGANDQRVAIRTGEDTVLHLCSSTGDVGLEKDLDVAGTSTITGNVKVTVALGVTGTSTLKDDVTFTDAKDISFGTSTGTKIGTATNQKIALYGETPVVQGAAVQDATGGSILELFNVLLSRMRDFGVIST